MWYCVNDKNLVLKNLEKVYLSEALITTKLHENCRFGLIDEDFFCFQCTPGIEFVKFCLED
jgi:hypothetical protein